MASNTESMTPNARFGSSFLDVLFNDHAVPDEVMMDKEAGDIVYKRRGDGRIMWYSQENIPLYTFMSQIRSRANSYNYYKRPDDKSSVYKDTYFLTCLMDVKDWVFDKTEDEPEGTVHSLLNGEILRNIYPDAFSVSQEANGFFLQLNVAPKDLAMIQLLNARYNMEYMSYSGEDEEGLKKKALFDEFNYANSPFIVNYTVTWYDLNGEIKSTETTDGYIIPNEVCFVPYKNAEIYSRSLVNSTKVKINYIYAPKLAEGLSLCTTESERVMLRAVMDTNDISFQTMNFSFFMTKTDDNLNLPAWISHSEVLLFMGLRDMEAALERSAGSGNGGGIVTSVHEPDEKTWKSTNLWIELMREFIPPDETKYLGSPTTISKIEDEMKGIEHVYANLSLDINSAKDFYVEKTGEIIIGEEDVS